MNLETIQAALPEYAKDLRLNLSALMRSEALSEQQLLGSLLATAMAAGDPELLRAVDAEVSARLSAEALRASRAAAAIMGMNNVYYRFVHLVGEPTYASLPARLRMQALANPGVEKVDFELWCLAVSIVNGCGQCIASHERTLRTAGASQAAVQEAARVAAVVHAVARVLSAERALQGPIGERGAA